MYLVQVREAMSKVYFAVLSLGVRRKYLRFRRAIQTIQIVFRYKKRLQLNRMPRLYKASADAIIGLFRMIKQVPALCYRFRYREILQTKAAEPTDKQALHRRQIRTQTQSTESSWPTSTAISSVGPNQELENNIAPDTVEPPSQQLPRPQIPRSNVMTFNREMLLWVNDDERVSFEILCSNCSVARKKIRVRVVCAGLRRPTNPSSTPQKHHRGRMLSNAGEFLTGLGTLFRSRQTIASTQAF
ncbi:hypothetical protein JG687_00017197 [Phytophthora cactorum]|uniref:Uncharacterized protein n=1 Tax=Phytophthora cactorum TaxID=29920 RepID=A0A8T1TNP4_9STRA|nr:hypothetical protein JG687_00017197 [Phytophthora cactorum]